MDTTDWVIDVQSNEDDVAEVDNSTIVRKIPKYHEQDALDDELNRKLQKQPLPHSKTSNVDALLKKSVIQPGFEQLKSLPSPVLSRRKLRRERKNERDRTKGPGWYNLPVQEMTEEIKNDLDVLRMRSTLDTKHFYKKNVMTHIPKYFQMGTVVETPADFYSGRIPKNQRKRTLVGELMADTEMRTAQKQKYKSLMNSELHKKAKKGRSKKLKDKTGEKGRKNKKNKTSIKF